ncbi:hypothetical protein GH714_030609 [Hevea brasiliensis]|uniref:Uncharacterized protein n=1 Tax=Hevea brasiliensis TaxID=3981 RepID=A0A6A6M300_HEVBR|nr:hypothetical protein GH714_030609 [Hevea brasiliensis]
MTTMTAAAVETRDAAASRDRGQSFQKIAEDNVFGAGRGWKNAEGEGSETVFMNFGLKSVCEVFQCFMMLPIGNLM